MAILESVVIPIIVGGVTGLASHLMSNQYVAEFPKKGVPPTLSVYLNFDVRTIVTSVVLTSKLR